jgi:hypothetical protein
MSSLIVAKREETSSIKYLTKIAHHFIIMKLYVSAIFTILLLSLASFAQTDGKKTDEKVKPDFSGTWVLDESKTKNLGYDLTLIVIHKEPEIKVTKTYDFKGAKRIVEQTYYTDGRQVANAAMGFSTISQKTDWQSDKLFHTQQASKDNGKTIEQTITEKWELSSDGKILTLRTVETASVQSKNMRTGQTGISQSDTTTVLKFKRGS